MPEYYGYVYQVYNNINNKFYIGQHAKSEFDKNYYGSGIHIKRAVKKYGKENFTLSVVYWAKDKDDLNWMEEFVVGAYLGNPKCYNIGSGGNCTSRGIKKTPRQIEAFRKAMTGRIRTEAERKKLSDTGKLIRAKKEYREQQSIMVKKIWDERKAQGFRFANREEINRKCKETRCKNIESGKVYKSRKKKVLCVETGIVYECATDAASHIGVGISAISNAVFGFSKTSGGYHWKYI